MLKQQDTKSGYNFPYAGIKLSDPFKIIPTEEVVEFLEFLPDGRLLAIFPGQVSVYDLEDDFSGELVTQKYGSLSNIEACSVSGSVVTFLQKLGESAMLYFFRLLADGDITFCGRTELEEFEWKNRTCVGLDARLVDGKIFVAIGHGSGLPYLYSAYIGESDDPVFLTRAYNSGGKRTGHGSDIFDIAFDVSRPDRLVTVARHKGLKVWEFGDEFIELHSNSSASPSWKSDVLNGQIWGIDYDTYSDSNNNVYRRYYVMLLDLVSNEQNFRRVHHAVSAIAYSPDHQVAFIAADDDGEMFFSDPQRHLAIHSLHFRHSVKIHQMAMHGNTIVTASKQKLFCTKVIS